jgi:hypothetical protein
VPYNSTDRVIAKVADLYFDQGEYKKSQETAIMLLDTSSDDRVRGRMTELIIKTQLELFKHENPAVQKHELSGELKLSIADQIKQAYDKTE